MGYKIALGVTGCIGAYKAILILRELQKAGIDVQVVMTEHACDFIQPLTFQSLSGYPVITKLWSRDDVNIKHIELAQNIDLLLIAPTTASTIGRLANGLSDDFLSTLYISTSAPVIIAPAMNTKMWEHSSTQSNIQTLISRGVKILEPDTGSLACRTVGQGRLLEPEIIVQEVLSTLKKQNNNDSLSGKNILVTAGPTIEDIDPVRFITNRSSGLMGYAIADVASKRGAAVTLISGPVKISPPSVSIFKSVRSTKEMYDAVLSLMVDVDVIIKVAAVCDYRPITVSPNKIKKIPGARLSIEFEPTEDILTEIGKRKGSRKVIGFAAETEYNEKQLNEKIKQKNVDFLVFNNITQPNIGFDSTINQVTIFSFTGIKKVLPVMSKHEVASIILDLIE